MNFGAGENPLERRFDAGLEAARRAGPRRRIFITALQVQRFDRLRGTRGERASRGSSRRRPSRRPQSSDGTRRSGGGWAYRPGPLALNGPVIVKVWMCGRPAQSKLSIELRRNGCRRTGSAHGRILDERHRDLVRSRGDRHTHAQPRIDRVAGVGRLLEQRGEVLVPADGREMNALAVHRELHVVRVLEAAHDVEIRPIELGLEHVVGVERERVTHQSAADRAERQPVDVLILREVLADAERIAAGRNVGVADGAARDLASRPTSNFSCSAGETPSTSEMLSKPYAESSGGSSDGRVDVEVEQVANRVGILRAIQPMQDRRAGIRMRGGLGVEGGFERRLHGVVRRFVWPADPLRRHGSRLQFTNDFLPELRVRPRLGSIEAFEREPARLQTLAVTTNAVLFDRTGVRRRRGNRRRLRQRSGRLGGL